MKKQEKCEEFSFSKPSNEPIKNIKATPIEPFIRPKKEEAKPPKPQTTKSQLSMKEIIYPL